MTAGSLLSFFALTLAAAPALAQGADYSVSGGALYGTVRGWTVVLSEQYGCSAYPEAMPIVFNTPPAGGWQLILPYTGSAPDGEYQGSIDVDKYSFTDTYFGEGGWLYASFPLEMRKAVADGQTISVHVEPAATELSLAGSTAALLKLEECWQALTGWTAEGSSRAGTFAFSGD